MGYVFTLEEFDEGRIPSAENYREADAALRNNLKELSDKDLIHGAIIHGSNSHSDGGAGSDLDVLVVTKNPTEAEERLRKINHEIRRETSVPVEFIPVSLDLAKAGMHNVDQLYFNYLNRFCKKGIIGKNPLEVINPNDGWDNPRGEVIKRFSAQLAKYSKARAVLPRDFGSEHCDFLEKIIRQPIYSAIDMLRVESGQFPSEGGRPLSKRECLQLYSVKFPQSGIMPELEEVLKTREEYRRILSKRMASTSEYRNTLERIDSLYSQARRVIETNLSILTS